MGLPAPEKLLFKTGPEQDSKCLGLNTNKAMHIVPWVHNGDAAKDTNDHSIVSGKT